jgi:tetratricopeptide (TPR) repeat protein
VNANALAEGLLARGLARRELGELDVARADLDAGLSRANASSSPALAALAELRIGEIVEVGGSTGNARARFATALELLASAPENETRTLREAEAHQRIGHALRREGALDEAASAIEAAATRYRKLGHDEGLAWALYEAAVVAMFRGRMDEALARFDEGLSVARRSGARTVGAVLTTGRGGLLQDLGKAEEALVHHADAAQVFRELGTRYREMSAVYYLATAYLDTGDAHEATRFLTFALELSRDVAVPRYEALIEGGRAVALAALGDRNSAEQALANAERARASCGSEHALRATIAIHGLTLAVQASAGDAARAVTEAEALASANPSDDSHFALRMLLVASGRRAQPTPNALVLFEDRRCVRLPRAKETTDLSGREPLWSIVRLLARRRNETPGEAVPVDDILAAAWPGERIGAEAAMNRIYVALATLRRLGLRPYLVTGSGGYLFSPAISVTVLP